MSQAQTALITGAGSGLGAAMAACYARAGWRVAVTDQDPDRAQSVARGLAGGGHLALALDVTDPAQWQTVSERVVQDFGRLDLLINNAGVAVAGLAHETPIEDWRWVMEINLFGVLLGCQQWTGYFLKQGFGHIVNVASWAGLAAAPQIAAYGTAKAAVVALSEMMRAELEPRGVGVSVLCPAFVKTRLTETMRAPDSSYAARVQRWMEHSGVGPENVAEQVMRAVERKRFWILTHRNTRWLWRLKRYFPERYFRLMLRAMNRR